MSVHALKTTHAVPFASAEAAWFWTAAHLRSRQDVSFRPPGRGPCHPDDVLKCLDLLYRERRVELLHVRILRIWGWRGVAPHAARARERCDRRLWVEVMAALDAALRDRGIVAGCGADWAALSLANSAARG